MVLKSSVKHYGLANVNDDARRVVEIVIEVNDGGHVSAVGSSFVSASVQIRRRALVLSECAGNNGEEYDDGTEHLCEKNEFVMARSCLQPLGAK
jgi:hypothetical protein